MDKGVFMAEYGRRLAQSVPTIEVACLKDSPETIIGFIAYTAENVHWAYTKADYRGQKVLNLLIGDKKFSNYTSQTLPGAAIARKKGWVFNPFKGILSWSNQSYLRKQT